MKILANSFKVNNLLSPVLDSAPHFSWILQSPTNREHQKSYQIQVFHGETIVWDSGVCETENNHGIYMDDSRLVSCTKYHVFLTVTDTNGQAIEAQTTFRTGKRGNKWNGHWITGHYCHRRDDVLGAPYLRQTFSIKKDVADAMLYICGLGYFVCQINGKRVNEDYFSTPYTDYSKHVMYRSFDVKDKLTDNNAIGVILGNGFYNCFTDDPWQTRYAPWRDVPKMRCELHIQYTDGTSEILASGNDWHSSDGPIIFNGIRHGEQYDARLEMPGWDTFDFSESNKWKPARIIRPAGGELIAMEMEPITIRYRLPAIKMWQKDERTLFDIGQNQAGICQLTLRGKAGDVITIRYCDLISEDGELNQNGINSFIKNYTFQTEIYTKKSDDPETWHSEFTYHGYQYVEISGGDTHRELGDVIALALCNNYENRGSFDTSNPVINQIQHMCRYSVTSCSMNTLASDSVREKSSWTGDTGFSAEEVLINFNTEQFMRRWLYDLRDSQTPAGSVPCIVPSPGWGYTSLNGPDWSSPIVDVPYYLWLYSGNNQYLAENYEMLKRHISHIESMADDDIPNYGLGDWCAPFEGPAISVNMSSFKCPVQVTDTAYYHSAVLAAATWAKILGYEEDALIYAKQAARIKAAFRRAFYNPETHIVKGNCQTATGAMIYHNICEPDEVDPLLEVLKNQIKETNGHLDFGVLGTKAVLNALGSNGLASLGISMLTNPTFPSCLRWIELGANTMWECWNGQGSHNHHMFSDISAFFYKYLGGISADPTEPGYDHIVFRPGIGCGIDYVHSTIMTPHGLTESSFANNKICCKIKVVVPTGAHATIYLPANVAEILDNATGSTRTHMTFADETGVTYDSNSEFLCYRLESGNYDITIQ